MNKTVSQIHLIKSIAVDFPNDATGEFEAYGAVFGNVDLTGDIIEPGAFAKTLREHAETKERAGGKVLLPLLFMHTIAHPIGAVLGAWEDAKGLRLYCKVDIHTEAGRQAYSGLREGYISQLSIGYDTIKAVRDRQGIRHLQEVRLHEISLIVQGYAANPLAMVDVASVKSILPRDAERVLSALAGQMRAWRERHGPVREPVHAEPAHGSAAPERDAFQFSSDYKEALERWHATECARGLPDREMERLNRATEAALARRLRDGTATLGDHEQWLRTHNGYRIDGTRAEPPDPRLARAVDEMRCRLLDEMGD